MKAPDYIKEVEGRLKELAEETDSFRKSDFFKQYLETMSKFWQYSYHNQLLIHFAMPTASRIAGFRKWQELNRKVKKGSKAIKILAPYIKAVKELDSVTLQEVEKEITLFFPVSVFDISQTDGEPLPEISITVDGDNYKDFLEALKEFCIEKQIKVYFKSLCLIGL